MSLARQHAVYLTHDLRRRAAVGLDRQSISLFDAAVDLNPPPIEATLAACQLPVSRGVVLAGEVELGKMIEAGSILCQYWAEGYGRLLVIFPASIRKQWAPETEEKVRHPAVITDAEAYRESRQYGQFPIQPAFILTLSFHFPYALWGELSAIRWDSVFINEAYGLRSAYRPIDKGGQGICWTTEDCREQPPTATPLQTVLLEVDGLSTLMLIVGPQGEL